MLQAWQAPQASCSQQTLSTQDPLAQSPPVAHPRPSTLAQAPVAPHAISPSQVPGSWAPITGEHVPGRLLRAQERHESVQAVSQQTPSTQKPEVQSEATEHARPAAVAASAAPSAETAFAPASPGTRTACRSPRPVSMSAPLEASHDERITMPRTFNASINERVFMETSNICQGDVPSSGARLMPRLGIGFLRLVLLAFASGGCGGPQPGASAAPNRADHPTCSSPSACGAGEVCEQGLCSTPRPTASKFSACALDLDCPGGDHCSLGACAHDCVSDRDCSGGLVCDARGRCQAAAKAGQTPAPSPPGMTSPVLALDRATVDLPAPGGSTPLTVRNTGGGTLEYRVLTGQAWIDATPVTGTIAAGEAATVIVKAAAGTMGAGRGSISVVSSGGTALLPVTVPARVAGLYRGHVTITAPEKLDVPVLGLYLEEDGTGALSGVVDAAGSPAFPFRAPLTAGSSVTGREVKLGFVIPSMRGTSANPDYPKDLLRKIEVVGVVEPSGRIFGTYTERLEGVFDDPAVVSGSIALDFVSDSIVAPTAEAVSVSSVALPPEPTFGSCTSCPSGACSGNPLIDGLDFLHAATPFLGYPIANTGGSSDAYASLGRCADEPSACLNGILLHCAQAKFFEATKTTVAPTRECQLVTGQADCATRGLLDSFKARLMLQAVVGNEWMARAQSAVDIDLPTQELALSKAARAFQAGYQTEATGAYPLRGLLDPYFAGWLSKLPPALFSGSQRSFLPEGLNVSGQPSAWSVVPAFADVDRLTAILSAGIRADLEDLLVRHRQAAASPQDLVLQASRTVVAVHIELALAGTLAARLAVKDHVTPAAAPADNLAGEIERISRGFNPAGYQDTYIEYTYNPASGAASNNFKAQLEHFRMLTLPAAKTSYSDALTATRTFESDQNALQTEIATYDDKFGSELAQLCGGSATTPSYERCGSTGGQVFQARQEVVAACLRGQDAAFAVKNAYSAIEIEMNRASQIAHLHIDTADLIQKDGTRLKALQDQERQIADAEGAANGFLGALSALGSMTPNPGAAVASIIGAAVSSAAGHARLDIDKERTEIATTEKARVEFNAANEVLIDSAARVKTALLDIPKQRINLALAELDRDRALAQLRGLYEQAIDRNAARKRFAELKNRDPRRDPSFRLYRDHRVADARRDFDDAIGELFVVTRSLEYELNYTYEGRTELFARTSPADLESYAQDLEAEYVSFLATIGPSQSRANTLSLRDQIYGFARPITDATTQRDYAPDELFHRLLADPSNRDAKGNLRLLFSFSLAPESTLFSTDLCNDRITGMRASLVGATLGALQPEILIQQKGTGYLRSCRESDANHDYLVRDYGLDETALGRRRAVIQAGVNLSGPNDANGPPVNTELYGRPIAATYEVVIDRTSPANRGLDLTKLDDIVLFVSHETRTVQ
jgi:Viral BACON domain